MLLLVVCLTGCAKGSAGPTADVTFDFENGAISYKGTPVAWDEFNGYSCKISNGSGGLAYEMLLEAGDDVTTISWNTQNVLEENMTVYKGKYYYLEYLESQFTMADPVSDNYFVLVRTFPNGAAINLVAQFASDYTDNIPMTDGKIKVDCGDFVVGNDYEILTIKPTYCVIPSVIKVSMEPCPDAVNPVIITQGNKEYTLNTCNKGTFTFYTYNGYTIQVAQGVDINSYITFK